MATGRCCSRTPGSSGSRWSRCGRRRCAAGARACVRTGVRARARAAGVSARFGRGGGCASVAVKARARRRPRRRRGRPNGSHTPPPPPPCALPTNPAPQQNPAPRIARAPGGRDEDHVAGAHLHHAAARGGGQPRPRAPHDDLRPRAQREWRPEMKTRLVCSRRQGGEWPGSGRQTVCQGTLVL